MFSIIFKQMLGYLKAVKTVVNVHHSLVQQLSWKALNHKSLSWTSRKDGAQFYFGAVNTYLQFNTTEEELATKWKDGTVSEHWRIQSNLGFGVFIYKR